MTHKLALSEVFVELKPSSTLYINETVNRKWQNGEQVFHMGFGESRFDVHPKLQQALANNTHRKSYLAARGLPELCTAVADYYSDKLSQHIDSQQIIVGPGSKSLIYSLQMALNSDLFLPTPSWVSYGPQAELLNRRASYIPATAADAYDFDLDAFDRLVQASDNPSKLLVLNSPNNPTGRMMNKVELQNLAAYCREHNILVLSDEIYFLVAHNKGSHVSISEFYPEGTIIMGGLSKHMSIGGWRLGVAIVPDTMDPRLMSALTVVASETWSSVAAPIQYAAITAYSNDPDIEQYIKDCANIHAIRTRHIFQQLSALGILCTEPEGAFYMVANFDRWKPSLEKIGITDSPALAEHLLENHSIATLPADAFGVPANELSLRLSTSYLDFETESDAERIYSLYHPDIDTSEFMSEKNHPNTHAAINAFQGFINSIN